MIERAGSGCTVVASGGNSSSRLPQPSSTASERVASKRPSGFETAPRPVRALGRVGDDMGWMVLDIRPVSQLAPSLYSIHSELATGAAAAGGSIGVAGGGR